MPLNNSDEDSLIEEREVYLKNHKNDHESNHRLGACSFMDYLVEGAQMLKDEFSDSSLYKIDFGYKDVSK